MNRQKNKEINIFNLSMLDIILSSMGAFLIIIFILFPHYNKKSIENLNDQSLLVQQKNQRINILQKVITQKNDEIEKLLKKIESTYDQRTDKYEKSSNINFKIQKLTKELKKSKKTIKKLETSVRSLESKLNYNLKLLKDRNIVFMLDISGSMDEKLIHVKAGLKMIVATMDESYSIDIVLFPYQGGNYKEYYGELKKVTEKTKYNMFHYMDNIVDQEGGTPTLETLKFILSNVKYQKAGSIIVLSDGRPENITSIQDIKKFVNEIKKANTDNKKINTIGIGKEFIEKDLSNIVYNFLVELAKKIMDFI